MHRLMSLATIAIVAAPLAASGDEVDQALASLEMRGAALTEMDERTVTATFSATPLSDADVKNLSTLSETGALKVVMLRGNDFSDRDAELLSQIKGLRTITLLKTRATEEVIETLHKSRPDLRIVRTGGPYLGLALGEDRTVRGVQRDSAAEHAGISVGDRLTKFAGHDITDIHDLLTLVARSKPDDIVDVEITRGDESKSLKLKMGKLTID